MEETSQSFGKYQSLGVKDKCDVSDLFLSHFIICMCIHKLNVAIVCIHTLEEALNLMALTCKNI